MASLFPRCSIKKENQHDDLVFAVALAWWLGENQRRARAW
jgi:hypothetical protein